MSTMKLVYKFRLKDKHAAELERQARAVSFVWNFCQDTQKNALRWGKKWPTGYDLQKLCAGTSKDLGLLSATINRVCKVYADSRTQQRKRLLRWRGKRSLGWIPLRDGSIRFDGQGFMYRGERLDAWVTRDIEPGRTFGCGSISQDARGRWYINLTVEIDAARTPAGTAAVGVDLGLRDLATFSDGAKVPAPQWYRRQQARLASAQRAGKKRQAQARAARVKNQRADHLHKVSAALVKGHAAIFVGDVSPSQLAKTNMAKSVNDAGWFMLKQQLAYKAIRHGVLYQEVREAFTTQTCNACGVVAGPKGRAGLNKRVWQCSCGVVHDRDVNAAKNILARGLASLAEGAVS